MDGPIPASRRRSNLHVKFDGGAEPLQVHHVLFVDSGVGAPTEQVECQNSNMDDEKHLYFYHLVLFLVLMNLMGGPLMLL